jgi:hypothetical protein
VYETFGSSSFNFLVSHNTEKSTRGRRKHSFEDNLDLEYSVRGFQFSRYITTFRQQTRYRTMPKQTDWANQCTGNVNRSPQSHQTTQWSCVVSMRYTLTSCGAFRQDHFAEMTTCSPFYHCTCACACSEVNNACACSEGNNVHLSSCQDSEQCPFVQVFPRHSGRRNKKKRKMNTWTTT